jgi:hypothetical protein
LRKRKHQEAEQPGDGTTQAVPSSEDEESAAADPNVEQFVPPDGSLISNEQLARMFAAIHLQHAANK